MAAEDMAFEQGAGTPDQLAQGEVGALNEQLPTTTVSEGPGLEAPVEEATPEEAMAPAAPADFEPLYEPESEDDDFIVGPTGDPDEPQWVGTGPATAIPPSVRRTLPALQRAAEDPEASETLKNLVAYVLRNA